MARARPSQCEFPLQTRNDTSNVKKSDAAHPLCVLHGVLYWGLTCIATCISFTVHPVLTCKQAQNGYVLIASHDPRGSYSTGQDPILLQTCHSKPNCLLSTLECTIFSHCKVAVPNILYLLHNSPGSLHGLRI